MSYVLRFHHAGRSVLLRGDVEQTGWDNLRVACRLQGVPLPSDMLVAGHQGRKSGYPDNGVLQELGTEAVIQNRPSYLIAS